MNKNLNMLVAAVLAVALALGVMAGCSTAGKRFNTSNISKIEKGVSTKADIKRYFGKPLYSEGGVNGRDIWTYTYTGSSTTAAGALGHMTVGIGESKTVVHSLTVVFEGDVVKDFRFSDSSRKETFVP